MGFNSGFKGLTSFNGTCYCLDKVTLLSESSKERSVCFVYYCPKPVCLRWGDRLRTEGTCRIVQFCSWLLTISIYFEISHCYKHLKHNLSVSLKSVEIIQESCNVTKKKKLRIQDSYSSSCSLLVHFLRILLTLSKRKKDVGVLVFYSIA